MHALRRRVTRARRTALLFNLATAPTFALAGGVADRGLAPLGTTATRCGSRRVVLITFLAANTLNFALIAGAASFVSARRCA